MELKYQARRLIHGVIKERWYAGQENKSPINTAPGGGGIMEYPTGGKGQTRSTPIARLWVAGSPHRDENPQLEGGEISYRGGTRRLEKLIPEKMFQRHSMDDGNPIIKYQ